MSCAAPAPADPDAPVFLLRAKQESSGPKPSYFDYESVGNVFNLV